MSNPIIKVENISKKYLIASQKTISGDSFFKNALATIKNNKQVKEEFYALQNISFNINKGDRVGIVGRNGAGKSTLLKILSRIVTPTTGTITYEGRMASLLEVGTGFHPELTGRENIFLNGSILGMTKHEISKKFDEIVAFAEIEKFIDTPVKRYSSGMYVRLAFAVAAHLDPEIMIVDEVLAVGDAAFQAKCMGKMEENSNKDGKTILFVSHNMGQVSSLCTKGILLSKGIIENTGTAKDIVNEYFSNGVTNNNAELLFDTKQEADYYISKIEILNAKKEITTIFAHDEDFIIAVTLHCNNTLSDTLLSLIISDQNEKKIFTTQKPINNFIKQNQEIKLKIKIPKNTLTPNKYKLSLGIHIPNIQIINEKKNFATVTIFDNGSEFYMYQGNDYGNVFVNCNWEI